MKLKAALTASMGGALEWYDFVVYGFFIQVLGRQLFPATNQYSQNLFVFWVFGMGYFVRPLGGLFFGYIGDKYGRKYSLYYSMILIGVITLITSIAPTYNYIGISAPLLFIIIRILQGFAVGGSITGSIIYISEISTPHTRSFWISMVFMGLMRGSSLAGGISTLLFATLSQNQLNQWGWRVAFLFGGLVMLVAVYAHHELVETPHHDELNQKNMLPKTPLKPLFFCYKMAMLKAIGISTLYSISIIFTFTCLPTFLQHYGLGQREAAYMSLLNIIIYASILPIFGWLGGKVGSKRMLIIGSLLFIFSINYYLQLLISKNCFIVIVGIVLLSLSTTIIIVSLPPILVGLFPTSVRYTGVSLAYNTCLAVFAGFAPLAITSLGYHLNSLKNSLVVIEIAAAIITIFASLKIKPEDDFLHRKDLKHWED